uniref:Uncharacterized protein n=1 Tax=Knipowitschia caucasica TaxID=637954 RepID=A0AAV2M776_KNICA
MRGRRLQRGLKEQEPPKLSGIESNNTLSTTRLRQIHPADPGNRPAGHKGTVEGRRPNTPPPASGQFLAPQVSSRDKAIPAPSPVLRAQIPHYRPNTPSARRGVVRGGVGGESGPQPRVTAPPAPGSRTRSPHTIVDPLVWRHRVCSVFRTHPCSTPTPPPSPVAASRHPPRSGAAPRERARSYAVHALLPRHSRSRTPRATPLTRIYTFSPSPSIQHLTAPVATSARSCGRVLSRPPARGNPLHLEGPPTTPPYFASIWARELGASPAPPPHGYVASSTSPPLSYLPWPVLAGVRFTLRPPRSLPRASHCPAPPPPAFAILAALSPAIPHSPCTSCLSSSTYHPPFGPPHTFYIPSPAGYPPPPRLFSPGAAKRRRPRARPLARPNPPRQPPRLLGCACVPPHPHHLLLTLSVNKQSAPGPPAHTGTPPAGTRLTVIALPPPWPARPGCAAGALRAPPPSLVTLTPATPWQQASTPRPTMPGLHRRRLERGPRWTPALRSPLLPSAASSRTAFRPPTSAVRYTPPVPVSPPRTPLQRHPLPPATGTPPRPRTASRHWLVLPAILGSVTPSPSSPTFGLPPLPIPQCHARRAPSRCTPPPALSLIASRLSFPGYPRRPHLRPGSDPPARRHPVAHTPEAGARAARRNRTSGPPSGAPPTSREPARRLDPPATPPPPSRVPLPALARPHRPDARPPRPPGSTAPPPAAVYRGPRPDVQQPSTYLHTLTPPPTAHCAPWAPLAFPLGAVCTAQHRDPIATLPRFRPPSPALVFPTPCRRPGEPLARAGAASTPHRPSAPPCCCPAYAGRTGRTPPRPHARTRSHPRREAPALRTPLWGGHPSLLHRFPPETPPPTRTTPYTDSSTPAPPRQPTPRHYLPLAHGRPTIHPARPLDPPYRAHCTPSPLSPRPPRASLGHPPTPRLAAVRTPRPAPARSAAGVPDDSTSPPASTPHPPRRN